MAFVKFLDELNYRECTVIPQGNLVTMQFKENTKVNTKGFDLFYHDHGVADIGGDTYHAFTTLYKRVDDKTFILSNDDSVWVPVTHFTTSGGGSLEGDVEQKVYKYSELVIPTPVDDETHKFVEWNPEIPSKGIIESDVSFTAVFEYIAPIEEVRNKKIAEFSTTCGSLIEGGASILTNGKIEHFSYTKATDQANIKELFDLATSTLMPQFYHCDGGNCRAYSVEEVIAIYGAECFNKNGNETYFNQCKQYISTLTDKAAIEALEYGAELPDAYNQVISLSKQNATAVLMKRIEGLDVDVDAIMAMIVGGQQPEEE